MAQLKRPISVKADFTNLKDIEADIEIRTKRALNNVLYSFKKELREMAISHIYNNAYQKKWYHRTHWLNEDDAIEQYIYKNTKDAYGGGLRFNRSAYDSFTEPFQHGNPVHYLSMDSYLEIMNNSSLLPSGDKNVYHFPTNAEIDRGHFYNEFLDLVDREFNIRFERAFEEATAGKPSIRGYSNNKSSSIGATSSSTRQYQSLNSRNI